QGPHQGRQDQGRSGARRHGRCHDHRRPESPRCLHAVAGGACGIFEQTALRPAQGGLTMTWRAAFAALLVLGLSACVSLPHPIGTSVGFKNDPALAGLWYGKSDKEDNDAGYYHVLLNADDTMTLVGVAAHTASPEKGGWAVLTATTVVLGNNHYING